MYPAIWVLYFQTIMVILGRQLRHGHFRKTIKDFTACSRFVAEQEHKRMLTFGQLTGPHQPCFVKQIFYENSSRLCFKKYQNLLCSLNPISFSLRVMTTIQTRRFTTQMRRFYVNHQASRSTANIVPGNRLRRASTYTYNSF